MQFTTSSTDEKGLLAVRFLASLGYKTRVLEEAETAGKDDVALFTPKEPRYLQGSRGRFLRTSAVKLTEEFSPTWAHGTPFRVAVIRSEKVGWRPKRASAYRWGFEGALANMAEYYQRWLAEKSTLTVPWTTAEQTLTPGSACEAAVKSWVAKKDVVEFRRAFTIRPSQSSDVTTRQIGQWQVNFCPKRIVFPAWAAEQGTQLLGKWQKHFVKEATWVQNQHGIPSLFVRFDCVVRDGQLFVYEVEERPAGVGLTFLVNGQFGQAFSAMAENWPQFRVEVSPLRRATDDHLWQEQMGWQNVQSNLVLVRAEPEETQFHHLEGQSVSSLKAKGNKSYGVQMGLWKTVSDVQTLPWSQAFVLKPLCGSKVRDLEFWDPQQRPGSSIRSKVEAELRRQKQMYMQLLHAPMDTGINKFPWMIYRVFFGYNPSKQSWVCLGGNWNARHNLRIHGASDAVFGPSPVE